MSEYDEGGEVSAVDDRWEETLERVLHYPIKYAPRGIEWRNVDTGDIVDIHNMLPKG